MTSGWPRGRPAPPFSLRVSPTFEKRSLAFGEWKPRHETCNQIREVRAAAVAPGYGVFGSALNPGLRHTGCCARGPLRDVRARSMHALSLALSFAQISTGTHWPWTAYRLRMMPAVHLIRPSPPPACSCSYTGCAQVLSLISKAPERDPPRPRPVEIRRVTLPATQWGTGWRPCPDHPHSSQYVDAEVVPSPSSTSGVNAISHTLSGPPASSLIPERFRRGVTKSDWV